MAATQAERNARRRELRQARTGCPARGEYKPRSDAVYTSNRDARRAERMEMLNAIKLEGCVDCGYNSDVRALQFDHVRGTKLFDVTGGCGRSLDSLSAEILKCDVRCANCHAIQTMTRRGVE